MERTLERTFTLLLASTLLSLASTIVVERRAEPFVLSAVAEGRREESERGRGGRARGTRNHNSQSYIHTELLIWARLIREEPGVKI